MTDRSDLERALDRYLADGAEQVPDRVIDAALLQVDQLPQRRAMRMPWRSTDMPTFLKFAVAGLAVVALVVLGGTLLTLRPTSNVGGPGGASPSPSASTAPSAIPSPSLSVTPIDTADWVTFTSDRYGYEVGHAPSWIATPAAGDWTFETSRLDFRTPDADTFIDEASSFPVRFTAFAADVPVGTSDVGWINAYYDGTSEGCGPTEDLRRIDVAGRSGYIGIDCNDAQAFLFDGQRVNVFAVWRPGQIALLEAFLSTIEFAQ